jgi:flagellar protein FliO/FliZ
MNGTESVRTGMMPRALFSVARLRRLGASAIMLVTSIAMAADDNKIIFPSGSPKSAAPAATSNATLNLITVLVALVIAAIGVWMFLRNRRSPGVGRDVRLLSIEETRSLGNRQYLVVASYEDKKFLLGVCPGRIDLLSPLHEEGEGGKSS